MTVLRRLGVVVLVIALTTTLFGANLAFGAERTVLNAEFVTSTLDEEGVYDDVLVVVRDQFSEVVENASGTDAGGESITGDGELPVSLDAIFERVVTEEYVRSQVEANVEGTIGYLHGDREEFTVAVDLRPVKTQADETVTAELQAKEPAELFGLFEGEATIENDGQTVPTIGLVGRMAANESAYRDARADFRESVREAAVENRTNAAFQSAPDDELLALVVEDYDPDAYDEAEKERMVAERESEIRAALRERIDAEVDDEMEELLEAQNAALRDAAASALDDTDADPALQDAFREVALLGVDGLTTDLSYDAFADQARDARDDLAVALSTTVVADMVSGVPDEMVLTENLDEGTMDTLSTARTAIGVLDALAVGLWLLAAVLVGALWWLGRSVVTTTVGAGVALLVAGSPVALATRWAGGRIRSLAPTDSVEATAFDVFVPVTDRVLSTVGTQSTALAVLGLLLVGIGLAVHLDLVPDDRPWDPR